MNAFGAAQTNFGSNDALIAAFTLAPSTMTPIAATPAFVNMMNLMLDVEACQADAPQADRPQADTPQASSQQQTASAQTAKPAAIAAPPAQIADSMIRSMLGAPVSSAAAALTKEETASRGNAKPEAVSTPISTRALKPAPLQDQESETPAVSSSPNPLLQKAVTKIQVSETTNQTSSKDALKSAAIRFALGSGTTLSNAAILTSSKTVDQAIATATHAPASHPRTAGQTPAPTQQPGLATDPQQPAPSLPIAANTLFQDQPAQVQLGQNRGTPNSSQANATAAYVPVTAPVIPLLGSLLGSSLGSSLAPESPAATSTNALASTVVIAQVAQEPKAPQAAAMLPVKNLAQSPIAFQAILTPMKDPTVSKAGAETVQRPPQQTIPGAPESNAALESNAAPAPAPSAAQAPRQTEVSAASSKPAPAAVQSDSREQPDSSASDDSSQQDDPQPAPARPGSVTSDPKAKTADVKQDDNSIPVPVAAHDRTFDIAPAASAVDPTRGESPSEPARPEPPAPFQATAETLRTVESSLPSTPVERTGTAQEIALRITAPDATPVDLRISERAGQVHVDVRTTDPTMQTSLRQDLGTLTSSLERAGYHSETFTPAASATGRPSAPQMSQEQGDQNPSQQRGGAGDFSGGRRRQQQQKRTSSWLEELETQQ